jgi:uncharacterized membrane protein
LIRDAYCMHRRPGMAAASLAAAMFIAGTPGGAAEVSDADVMAIMQRHCVTCHAKKPTHPSFDAPPKNVSLETIDEVRAWAVKIVEQVLLDRTMPVGNETEMTEEERAALARWLAGLK